MHLTEKKEVLSKVITEGFQNKNIDTSEKSYNCQLFGELVRMTLNYKLFRSVDWHDDQ